MRTPYLWLALLAGCSGTPALAPDLHPAASAASLQTTEDVHQIVGRLTSRRAENTEVTTGPKGFRIFQIKEGLGEVVVARTNSDGSISTKCVDSEQDSRSFLGDPAQAPARGRVR